MSLPTSRLAHLAVPALVSILVVAAIAALWPAVASIASNWTEIHDYQHGFLIAPIALGWLLWVAWGLRSAPVHPAPVGLVALLGALFAWLIALRAHSDIAMEALFPAIVWCAIWTGAGWRAARDAAAPISYLYFAIPVWEFLQPTLQWLSVHVTEAALAIGGIPAQVSEYVVTLPAGSFEIVEGCSGKRYFVVALAVSVVAGVFRQLQGWRLLALVALGGALALVANWFRIFVVIAAGHASEMQHYLVAVEHQTFGNVVFALLLVAIYVAAAIAARRPMTGARAQDRSTAGAGVKSHPVLPGAAFPFLALAATAAVAQLPAPAAAGPKGGLPPLPVAAGDWQGPMPAAAAWSPDFQGPDAERQASYRRVNGGTVEVYLNLYRSQQPGRELVYFRNHLMAPDHWTRSWPRRVGSLEVDRLPALAVMEAHGPTGQRWFLAYVYKIGAWTTVHAPVAQAAYGLQSLIRPAPAGIVAMTVQCQENCQEAQGLVQLFWQEMSSSLLGMIPDHAG